MGFCLVRGKCLFIGLFGFSFVCLFVGVFACLFICLFVPENVSCLFVNKQVFPRKHTSGPDLDKWHAGLVKYQKATPKELIAHLLLAYGPTERNSQSNLNYHEAFNSSFL